MPMSKEKRAIQGTLKQMENVLATFVENEDRGIPDSARKALERLRELSCTLRSQMQAEIDSRSNKGTAQIISDYERARVGENFEVTDWIDDFTATQ